MIKWAFCVLLTSIAGSMLYMLWLVLAQFFQREEFLYAQRCGIRLTALSFLPILAGGMGYSLYIELQPGTLSWSGQTVATRKILIGMLIIWSFGLAGRISAFLYSWLCQQRLHRTYLPCDLETVRLFGRICQEVGVKRKIAIAQSMAVPTARLEGIFCPRICIPMAEYSEGELRVILKHELAHYLNHDGWMRGYVILLACVHWFNPLVSLLNRSMECWNEYYCDYRVCHQYGVRKEEYIKALVTAAERTVGWREQIRKGMAMDVAFVGKGQNLKERIRRIKMYKAREKKETGMHLLGNKGYAAVLNGTLVLAGCAIVLAVAAGAETVYGKAIDMTWEMSSTEETMDELPELEEYTMAWEETPFAEDIFTTNEEAAVCAESTGMISASIQNDEWKSGKFDAVSGQEISILVSGTPANVSLQVGIVEPDGNFRFVSGSGNVVHTFSLSMDGKYFVCVWNRTSTEVTIMGHYITNDPK